MKRSDTFSDLDRQVACALQVNGRAGWAQIAKVLGVSERTVARRAQPLLDSGTIRVVATVDTQRIGWGEPALLRLRCQPGATRGVAMALAESRETRTVMLTEGSTDCFVEVVPPHQDWLREFLLDRLPGLSAVAAHHAHSTLRFFRPAHEWRTAALSEQQADALERKGLPPFATADGVASLSAEEEKVVHELTANGRIPVGTLANRVGVAPATASRQIDSLIGRGIVRIRTEVDRTLLGLPTEALLWVRVRPSDLDRIGQVLSRHPAVRMAAAVTGDYQLCVDLMLSGRWALYQFVTQTLGAFDGIIDFEVLDVLATIKRAGLIFREPGRKPH
ncbi:Lrp/AsnC family transcriptional regulator [Kribbella sp. NPDC048915]|uniref:Lrp/AsnC family transcriptional regulator n=1 Tax=Kribbella sp. NPDC048915 TaxID=3155148 RepID=UPI0033F88607